MKWNRSTLLALGFILVGIFIIYVEFRGDKTSVSNEGEMDTSELSEASPEEKAKMEAEEKAGKYDCDIEEKKQVMSEAYMRPLIKRDDKYVALLKYYDCHPIHRGDVVLAYTTDDKEPVVRIVRGVPGDKYQVISDTKNKSWNIKINEEILKTDTTPYYFGSVQGAALLEEQKSKGPNLGNDEFILFSMISPGSRDSGMVGRISRAKILGKVKTLKK
jgi:hypothetical protein